MQEPHRIASREREKPWISTHEVNKFGVSSDSCDYI